MDEERKLIKFFVFKFLCSASKGFMKVLKALIKPHSVHPLPLHRLSAGGGDWTSYQIFKKGGLGRISIFRGGFAGKEGVTFSGGLQFLDKK